MSHHESTTSARSAPRSIVTMTTLTMQACRRRLVSGRRLSSLATATSNNASPPPAASTPKRLPTRHSIKKLPLICTDPAIRTQLTQDVLQAPWGSLFSYVNNNSNNNVQQAWHAADATVQKVEFVLRGHAHGLSGTTWHRWLPRDNTHATTSDEITETLLTMQQLVHRLHVEGASYMQLRAARLEEIQGPKVNAHVMMEDLEMDLDDETDEDEDMVHSRQVFDSVEALQDDINAFARDQGIDASSDSDSDSDSSSSSDSDNESDDISAAEPTYMDDFAIPGPTTHMYDTLLDAMACHAGNSTDVVTARDTYQLLEEILSRHAMDGGDAHNAMGYTRPTIQSYNASIRVAAQLPFDASDTRPSNLSRRDDAIHLGFCAFGALSESQLVQRNSATYTYLLQVISKYFPASRSRGHIARGMLLHARDQGLLDAPLLEAYRLANEPSNGSEFDATLALLEEPVPHKWRANNRKWRSHAREATY